MAALLDADDPARAERERIAHLVLGHGRPPPRRIGRGKSKRKVPVVLSPGIEEVVARRERWEGRAGTPETLDRVREGALARLYRSGAIDAEQLASAEAILSGAELVGSPVALRTASLETRVDVTRLGDGSFYEALGRVRLEMAYGRWRAQVRGVALVLEIIVGDVGITEAARRFRVHKRRAKKLLIDALDAWPPIAAGVYREVDPASLAAAHAAIL